MLLIQSNKIYSIQGSDEYVSIDGVVITNNGSITINALVLLLNGYKIADCVYEYKNDLDVDKKIYNLNRKYDSYVLNILEKAMNFVVERFK